MTKLADEIAHDVEQTLFVCGCVELSYGRGHRRFTASAHGEPRTFTLNPSSEGFSVEGLDRCILQIG